MCLILGLFVCLRIEGIYLNLEGLLLLRNDLRILEISYFSQLLQTVQDSILAADVSQLMTADTEKEEVSLINCIQTLLCRSSSV